MVGDSGRSHLKTLYFDIDGTVRLFDQWATKKELRGGRFGAAVRAAGCERLVCVGNAVGILHFAMQEVPDTDSAGTLLELMEGAFDDEAWFRSVVVLARDPFTRGEEIDLDGDWWYADDLAEDYLVEAGRRDVFEREAGRRIHVAEPRGTGARLLAWLENVVGGDTA
jgi:hypothetical protein